MMMIKMIAKNINSYAFSARNMEMSSAVILVLKYFTNNVQVSNKFHLDNGVVISACKSYQCLKEQLEVKQD